VLPVGGIKEKILAAKRAGVTDIVLCIDNKKDIEDIKPVYLEGLSFHYVRDISEVLDYALLDEPVKNPKKFVTTPPAPQAPTPAQP
jgi:ATP-dependent Lon protease